MNTMVGQTRALLEWAKLHFRTLTLITAACTVIGIVVALLLPVSYMAEAILLPPGDGGTVRPGLLSQLSAFTGAIAVSPLASFGPLYPDIARSRVVLLPVLDREFEGHTYREWFGEAKALSPTEEEKLYLDLRKHVTGYVNPLTSLITLEATAPRPELAAGFLNEVLARMDVFFQTRLVTEAREQRLALERRLEELERSLKNSEEALEKFLMANRQPQLSPNVELTESRLRREVTINSSMYTELKQQYELTRIKEIGSTPALKVLSAPTPPLHRSAPRRSLIVILATALGGMLALGIVRIREMWSEDATVRQ